MTRLDPLFTVALAVLAVVAIAWAFRPPAEPSIKLGPARQEIIRQRLLETAP